MSGGEERRTFSAKVSGRSGTSGAAGLGDSEEMGRLLKEVEKGFAENGLLLVLVVGKENGFVCPFIVDGGATPKMLLPRFCKGAVTGLRLSTEHFCAFLDLACREDSVTLTLRMALMLPSFLRQVLLLQPNI